MRLQASIVVVCALLGPSCGDDVGTNGESGSTSSTTGPSTTITTSPSTTTSSETGVDTTALGTETSGTTDGSTSGGTSSGGEDTSSSSGDKTTGGEVLEAVCLVTHDGGSPVTSSVVRVAVDGGLALIDQAAFVGGHTPGQYATNYEAITRCGDRVYYALSDDDAIATARLLPAGTLSGAASYQQFDAIDGLFCDDASSTLLSYGDSDDGTVAVVRYAVMDDGQLEVETSVDLDFANPELLSIRAALHPTLPLLYVSATSDGSPYPNAHEATVVDFGTDGALVVDAMTYPVLLGENGVQRGLLVAPQGDILYIVGYSGGCGAYLDLPAEGSVPAAGLEVACNGFGAMSAAFRTADHIFYQKHENPNVVQIAELDAGFVEHGAVGGTTPYAILRLAYDESILIEGGQSGAIATYSVSPDGLTVAPLETLDIGTPEFQAGVLVPCE